MASKEEEEDPELAGLAEEITALRDRLEKARAEVADTDFATLRDDLHELGYIKVKKRRKLAGHLAKVTDIQWGGDSVHLLSAGQDGNILVWDVFTKNKLFVVGLKTPWVIACAFSPSQQMIASGGLDDVCSLHDLRSRDGEPQLDKELKGHTGFISGIQFLDEGTLITASGDKTCAQWDVERSRMVNSFKGHADSLNGLALSNTEPRRIVTASCDFSCKLWDVRDQNCVQTFRGHESEVNSVSFFPQNEYGFVSAGDAGVCILWDIRADQPLAQYVDNYINCGCTTAAFSKSGRLLFAGYDDYNCHVWDAFRRERVGIMQEHDGRVSRVSVSPDGLCVATSGWDNMCFIWTCK